MYCLYIALQPGACSSVEWLPPYFTSADLHPTTYKDNDHKDNDVCFDCHMHSKSNGVSMVEHVLAEQNLHIEAINILNLLCLVLNLKVNTKHTQNVDSVHP